MCKRRLSVCFGTELVKKITWKPFKLAQTSFPMSPSEVSDGAFNIHSEFKAYYAVNLSSGFFESIFIISCFALVLLLLQTLSEN